VLNLGEQMELVIVDLDSVNLWLLYDLIQVGAKGVHIPREYRIFTTGCDLFYQSFSMSLMLYKEVTPSVIGCMECHGDPYDQGGDSA